MTLIYRWNKREMSLEYFIQEYNFQELWDKIIQDEYKFWNNITMDNLIIEASDVFEETMNEKRWYIEFVKDNKEPFDYNILLNGLRNR